MEIHVMGMEWDMSRMGIKREMQWDGLRLDSLRFMSTTAGNSNG